MTLEGKRRALQEVLHECRASLDHVHRTSPVWWGGASVTSGTALDRAGAAAQLDDRLTGANVSDPTRLPIVGRGEYNGYMRARLPTGPDGARVDYLGDLTIDVNFGAGFDQIRGQASGFKAANNTALAGALAITDGNIYRDTDPTAAYSFDGDVDGTLTGGSSSYIIDAEIEGEFLGRNQDAVSGVLFGDVTGPAWQDIFDGSFAATRQEN